MTPSKNEVTQSLHGSIYDPVTVGNFTYHRHAAITGEAKLSNPVWTIWREDDTTGALTVPEVNSLPNPDNNVGTSPELLTYWATV